MWTIDFMLVIFFSVLYWGVLILQFAMFSIESKEHPGRDFLNFLPRFLIAFIIVFIILFGFAVNLKAEYFNINLGFMVYFSFLVVIFIFFCYAVFILFKNIKMSWVHKVSWKVSYSKFIQSNDLFYFSLFAFLMLLPVIFYYLLLQMNDVSVSINSFYYDSLFKMFCSTFYFDILNGWFGFIIVLLLFVLAAFLLGFNVYIFFFLFIFFISFQYLIFDWFLTGYTSIRIGFIRFDPILTQDEYLLLIRELFSKEFLYLQTLGVDIELLNPEFERLYYFFQENNIYNPRLIYVISKVETNDAFYRLAEAALKDRYGEDFYYYWIELNRGLAIH